MDEEKGEINKESKIQIIAVDDDKIDTKDNKDPVSMQLTSCGKEFKTSLEVISEQYCIDVSSIPPHPPKQKRGTLIESPSESSEIKGK